MRSVRNYILEASMLLVTVSTVLSLFGLLAAHAVYCGD
jgi:hypothetical protein